MLFGNKVEYEAYCGFNKFIHKGGWVLFLGIASLLIGMVIASICCCSFRKN